MNTFLPYADFMSTAECLDSKRLRNQLNEYKVIRAALGGAKAWARHPAVLMWAGHVKALDSYAYYIAEEMRCRGMPVPAWAPETHGCAYDMPPWFGCPVIHESHRRNLLRKDYQHYRPYFLREVEGSDVYAWPTRQPDGTWVIRFKKVGAKNYESRTEPLLQEIT